MSAKVGEDQSGRDGHQIALSSENEDSLVNRDFTVRKRTISLAVEFRVIGLVLLEDVVDGSQWHSGNGDDSLLVAAALFESKVAIVDFRKLPDYSEDTVIPKFKLHPMQIKGLRSKTSG